MKTNRISHSTNLCRHDLGAGVTDKPFEERAHTWMNPIAEKLSACFDLFHTLKEQKSERNTGVTMKRCPALCWVLILIGCLKLSEVSGKDSELSKARVCRRHLRTPIKRWPDVCRGKSERR